ncbi:MAG: D-alanyl-D-alanine carboxypeptidase [Hyphomonadaceae bacterium]|jgi:D-alanyl-D-alanine carboxypeptidase|uniref:D-alanyl-D-alanine carboxypeptidase n=1 Tax=Aquidulcibacter sp. TaxID=2052990 RepID=UPI0022C349FB|nr:D-alanyl-D-alanine carboxypeptidase [Aquidulcibacter sp.]MCZ8207605.1 D-alanyl-D-alanine carboxypeptidase [Aquidulcibacter sp.]
MTSRKFSLRLITASTMVAMVSLASTSAVAQANPRFAQIVVDADTNEVIYEENAQALRRPASITKVMTLYLLFDALQTGAISWNDQITFSRFASNQAPTKLGIAPGNSISVQTAVEALVVRSANDVAAAVAERLGGSEANFAMMMTAKARDLGMVNTTFANASGLPSDRQVTTAEDLARLAIAIRRDFPDQYHWFSLRQMVYNGRVTKNHNHLMARMEGMDGLKTGFTRSSGFNLAATTERNGRRIVTVVLGGRTRFSRDDFVELLTESAFKELGTGANLMADQATPYQYTFQDPRDGADAEALVMSIAGKALQPTGATNLAFVRTQRTRGFDQGQPSVLMANATAQLNQSARLTSAGVQTASLDQSNDDEDQAEAVSTQAVSPSKAPRLPRATSHYVATSALQTPALRPVMDFPASTMATSEAAIQDAKTVEVAAVAEEQIRLEEARAQVVRQANERRAAERAAAEARSKATAERDERTRQQAARALAAKKESDRQLIAGRARGDAIVQVGAFRSQRDANAALAQFSRHFPSFASREVSSVKRSDGVWYRARFSGLGASVAREACRIVSGRGGSCQIIAD